MVLIETVTAICNQLILGIAFKIIQSLVFGICLFLFMENQNNFYLFQISLFMIVQRNLFFVQQIFK